MPLVQTGACHSCGVPTYGIKPKPAGQPSFCSAKPCHSAYTTWRYHNIPPPRSHGASSTVVTTLTQFPRLSPQERPAQC